MQDLVATNIPHLKRSKKQKRGPMHRHLQYAGTLICDKHSKNYHTFFPQRAKPIIKQAKGNQAQVDFWDLVIYFISENFRKISYQFKARAIL